MATLENENENENAASGTSTNVEISAGWAKSDDFWETWSGSASHRDPRCRQRRHEAESRAALLARSVAWAMAVLLIVKIFSTKHTREDKSEDHLPRSDWGPQDPPVSQYQLARGHLAP